MCRNPGAFSLFGGSMRIRRIAILIDGGFFLKRLSNLVKPEFCNTAEAVANSARVLCKRHVQRLIREDMDTESSCWLDHLYRIFFYDAVPYDGIAHHPISNSLVRFAETSEAKFRHELFGNLRKTRKFALRLGKVSKEHDWKLKDARLTKKLLRTHHFADVLNALVAYYRGGCPLPQLGEDRIQALEGLAKNWCGVTEDDVRLGLRQKGVDMRIGIDIASLTLKKQVDTIILVTGDSDFVPAAKVARREGVEFLIDPLWQKVNDDLHEHVDGVVSVFKSVKNLQTRSEDDLPQQDE